MVTIDDFIRKQARELGLNVSKVCKKAGISRQTFYLLAKRQQYPDLKTMVQLAGVLRVHPMILLQIVFEGLAVAESIQLPSDTADKSAFIDDVTYPDGAPVPAGSVFVKTWVMQNVGSVPWVGRVLRCCDDDLLVYHKVGGRLEVAQGLVPTVTEIPVPTTEPGEKVTMSVEFTAPKLPGTVLSYWKSFYSDGTPCFPDGSGVWAKVRVTSVFSGAHAERV